MNKKLLFISYYWSLSSDPTGIQNRRIHSGLKKYYDIIVYYRDFSGDTKEQINANESFRPVKSIDLSIIDKTLFKIFPFLQQIFSFDQFLWSIICYWKIVKHGVNYDLNFITFSPFPIYLVAWLLKKKYNKPLVCHFYDPLIDNRYLSQNKISLGLRRWHENLIVSVSEIVFLSNKLLLDLFVERYKKSENKCHYLPFCSDEIQVITSNQNQRLTLIHAGNLYGHRNLKFVNMGVTKLRRLYPNLSDSFQIILYGGITKQDKQLIKKSNNDDVILYKGVISKENLYLEYSNADGLIVIDSLDFDNVFFPSKLCEYFLFNKIILAITPEISATREYIVDSGHLVFSPNQIDGFVHSLSELMVDSKFYNSRFKKNYYTNFLPANVAEKFANVIIASGIILY